MRNLTRLSVLLPLLLVFGSTPSLSENGTSAEAGAGASPFNKTDEKIFQWCLSHFPPGEESPWADDGATLLPRPVEKLRPFNIKNALVPPDLITETRIVGELPPAIEKYKGQWIFPSISVPPINAIFIERLTPMEMTIAMIPGSGTNRQWDEKTETALRQRLKWTGRYFSTELEDPRGVRFNILVSGAGHAMFVVMADSREAWPFGCFISSKHY